MDRQLTPEGFRTAAYLEVKARLDARRKTKNVNCNPPNTKCGNRCIPAEWDCRLKGEGSDRHLAVVKTDPLGGLANIQRGINRITRGIAKGSFSEVEGGKRSIIRGTVKASPGSFEQKKELRTTLEERTRLIGISLAVLTGGLGAHTLLLRSNAFGYRTGLGRDINTSFRNGVNAILDTTPIIGAQREAVRRSASANVQQAAGRFLREEVSSPAVLKGGLDTSSTSTLIAVRQTRYGNQNLASASQLSKSLNAINKQAGNSRLNYTQWREQHREQFWNQRIDAPDLVTKEKNKVRINIFARPAAHDFLRAQYNLPINELSTDVEVRRALRNFFKTEQESFVAFAKQQGYRTKAVGGTETVDPEDQPAFISFLVKSSLAKSNPSQVGVSIKNNIAAHIERVLALDHQRYANSVYRSTVYGYDQFYGDVGLVFKRNAGVSMPETVTAVRKIPVLSPQQRNLAQVEDIARANYLLSGSSAPAVVGPAHAELVQVWYYHTKVNGKASSEFIVSDRLAKAAASELSGRSITSTSEAETLLRTQYGFNTLSLPRARRGVSSPRSPENGARPASRGRRRVRSREEIIAELLSGDSPYSQEQAERLADEIIAKRKDDDEPDMLSPREASFLLTQRNLQERQDFTPNAERQGKPCGRSFIPRNTKCSKPTTARYAQKPNPVKRVAPEKRLLVQPQKAQQTRGIPPRTGRKQQESENNTLKALGIAAGAVAAFGLAGMSVNARQVSRYRKNVAKSAVEAEKLGVQMEQQMRESAARRLRKNAKDVDGFEASVYNYKDKGYDRGFGSMDNTPEYFGQTKNSRGAVVMLSYADDGKHTIRGQGGFKMATGGAFKEIWGEHDILPYANNISQPDVSAPDDLDNMRFNKLVDKVRAIAGDRVANTLETSRTGQGAFKRFGYLQKNVKERGFNPDSVRVAAFVAAQRRLTGKQVHIMSYSNGGNVATEALAILKEMGYQDVKVVNVAGPTFGLFKHSSNNMQTWVSEGDEFWQMSRGLAFSGSKVNKLKNGNIPHGLQDGIDPNDKRKAGQVKANLKARNSYLLDRELQRDAFKFLTVDKRRSQELLDETIWRVSEKKGFDGDLANLYGDQSTAKFKEYSDRLMRVEGAEKERVKQQIRDEIEDQMIEKWYGGYEPKKVKRRATEIRTELNNSIKGSRNTRSASRPNTKPLSLSQMITKIKAADPTMSDAAARAEALRRIKQRSRSSE